MGTLDLIDAYTDIANKLATMKLREAFDIAEAEEELGITVVNYDYMGKLVRFAIKLLDNGIEHGEIIDSLKDTYDISKELANKAFKIAEVIRRERE